MDSGSKVWILYKLKDVSKRITRKNKEQIANIPLTISDKFGLIDQREYFTKKIASKDMSHYILLKKGEFAYNKSYSKKNIFGTVARLDNYDMGALSTLYIAFEVENADSTFIQKYYESDKWHYGISKIANEGARNHGLLNISTQDFFDTRIKTPNNLDEQTKIGIILEKLDNIITLEQEKHELLVNYKKYLIQNVFKQEHSKTKSLKEVATITTGKLNANAMVKDGRYDFYTSGISKYKINEYAFEGPAITIAGNGATVGFMHMANGKFNAYQRTYVLQNFKINRDYLFYNIQKELPRKIHEESRTGSIPYIVMDMLEDLPIYVTDQNKMNQLGNLLYLVNSILDKSSLRIEKIIKTKDFLLQQLFI